MDKLKLNIYDDSNKEVVKTVESNTFDLTFGTIRTLMDLLKIESLENTMDMLKTIYGAWNEIKNVLGEVFPDMKDEDWNHVKVKELVPVIINIGKFAITDALSIPSSKAKN